MTNNTDTTIEPTALLNKENTQSARIRRLLLVFSSYMLVFFCVILPAHFFGFSHDVSWAGIFLFLVLPFASFYLCLFILMYSGISRRLVDPGLLFVQQFVGVIVTTVICYYAIDAIRGACLILYIHIFYSVFSGSI